MVGVEPRASAEQVRAVMLARLAGFAEGRSGASPEIVAAYIGLLNAGVIPVMPLIGSVGEPIWSRSRIAGVSAGQRGDDRGRGPADPRRLLARSLSAGVRREGWSGACFVQRPGDRCTRPDSADAERLFVVAGRGGAELRGLPGESRRSTLRRRRCAPRQGRARWQQHSSAWSRAATSPAGRRAKAAGSAESPMCGAGSGCLPRRAAWRDGGRGAGT